MVVVACESVHVCTMCIWRCEQARFCVEVLYGLQKFVDWFIHYSYVLYQRHYTTTYNTSTTTTYNTTTIPLLLLLLFLLLTPPLLLCQKHVQQGYRSPQAHWWQMFTLIFFQRVQSARGLISGTVLRVQLVTPLITIIVQNRFCPSSSHRPRDKYVVGTTGLWKNSKWLPTCTTVFVMAVTVK